MTDLNKLNISLNLSHNNDSMGGITPQEAVDNLINFQDGFVKFMEGAVFTTEKSFKSFLSDIEKEFGPLERYEYSDCVNGYSKFMNDKFRCYSAYYGDEDDVFDITSNWYCKDETDLHKTWTIYRKHTKSGFGTAKIEKHEYYIDDGRVNCSTHEISRKNVDCISKLYYPYIDTDLMFEQFFTGQENILLLVGESGLGKSKLSTLALKYMLDNPDKVLDKIKQNDDNIIHMAYVKSNDVLAKDSFWVDLVSGDPTSLVIIDDLDYMLTKRDAEVMSSDDTKKNSFINQFLSFTDGMIKNKTKFIITTNQPYDNIDSALLRKGRLFDILELRRLHKKEALEVWKDNELPEKEFLSIFGNYTNILSADLGSEIARRLNTKIKERATLSYLSEDGISRVRLAKAKKKLGI
jgi:hypothetical protein